jgi:F-type H+-transporting ATPase subunit epsilon
MAHNSEAATSLTLQIVTPKGMVEDTTVSMVTLPGVEGDFGVLPGHAPFLSILKAGGIYFDEGGMPRVYVVSAGFAEVTADKVLVVARTCEKSGNVDLERAEKARKDLETSLTAMAPEDENRKKQEERLSRAVARIQASKGESPYS